MGKRTPRPTRPDEAAERAPRHDAATPPLMVLLFRLLPLLGMLLIGIGMGIAVYHMSFPGPTEWLIVVGVALFLTLFGRAEVANLKFYLHVGVYSLLVLGLTVVVYLFAARYSERLDLTEGRLFSLSEETRRLLNTLQRDVTITIFTDDPEPYELVAELYERRGPRVRFEFIDPRREILRAEEYGEAAQTGQTLIESGDKRKVIPSVEIEEDFEKTLTNAILDVTRADRPKVYYLQGHGEMAYERVKTTGDRLPPESIHLLRELLEPRAVDNAKLDLAVSGFVPDDASLVIVAGPSVDLPDNEIAALKEFLERDGKLLVLIDAPIGERNDGLPKLRAMLAPYGVSTPNEIVFDLAVRELDQKPFFPLLASYAENHVITERLAERPERVTMPSLVRPVEAAHVLKGRNYEAVELLYSSDLSFTLGAEELVRGGEIKRPDRDDLGPRPMGVAVGRAEPPRLPGGPRLERGEIGWRIVVLGTSALAADQLLAQSVPLRRLMLNTVNWLLERDDMIAVPPRQLEGTPIILNTAQQRVIFVLTVLLLPGALFFGGVTWATLRRRR